MKKIGLILALLAMIAGLAACEKSNNSNNNDTQNNTETTVSVVNEILPEDPPTIDVENEKPEKRDVTSGSDRAVVPGTNVSAKSGTTKKNNSSEKNSEDGNTLYSNPVGSGIELPEIEVE